VIQTLTQVGVSDNWLSLSYNSLKWSVWALNGDDIFAWGMNGSFIGMGGEILSPTMINQAYSWLKLSTGRTHIAGITVEGDLYMAGFNNYGQLGDGGVHYIASTPIKVALP
jgi:alpha-tubulin suppressor-like RCC1 family protein